MTKMGIHKIAAVADSIDCLHHMDLVECGTRDDKNHHDSFFFFFVWMVGVVVVVVS